jgi:hypothetical protein
MIGVIVNPYAGKNLKGKFDPQHLETILDGRAIARTTQSISDIGPVLSDFYDHGIDTLCISGGDGTIHFTLTELIHFAEQNKVELPYIYPLRGGVVNMVADDLTMHRGNPETLSEELLTFHRVACPDFSNNGHIANPPLQPLPILKVEDPEFNREVYAFTFSNGILLKALEDYYSGRKTIPSAAWLAARIIFGGGILRNHWANPTPGRIWADGEEMPFSKNLLTLAATLRRLVLGFSPWAPYSGSLTTNFHALSCGLTAGEVMRHFPTYIRGKRSHERLLNRTTQELIVEGQDGYILDGEVHRRDGPYRIRITCGPIIKFLDTKQTTQWGKGRWDWTPE